MIIKLHSGYILFIVLIFLQIFCLLGLYELSSIMSLLKTDSQSWERKKLLLHLHSVLHHLENNFLKQEINCLIPVIAPSLLIKKSSAWWNQHACHNIKFNYVVEFLGENACAIVGMNSNNETLSAKYYRITLMDLSAKIAHSNLLLQSVIATTNNKVLACFDKPFQAVLGEQMLREL